MHTLSIFVASVAALAVASAEVERPQYYYPKHVKRQFFRNTTLTTTTKESTRDVVTSSFTPTGTTKPDTSDFLGGITRGTSLSDLLSTGSIVSTSSSDSTTNILVTNTQAVSASTSASDTSNDLLDTSAVSSGTALDVIVFPTTSADGTTSDDSDPAATTTGIEFGPSGIITPTPTSAVDEATTTVPNTSDDDSAASSATSDTGILPILSSIVVEISTAVDLATISPPDSSSAAQTFLTDGINGPSTGYTSPSTAMDSVTISSEIPTFTFPSEISTILSTSVTDILPIPTLSDIPQTSSDIIVPTSVVPTDTPLPTDTAIPTETVVPTDTSLPNLTIPLSIPLTTDIPSLKTPITIVSPTVSPTASPTILIPVPTDTPSLTVPITIVSPTVSPTISIPFTTDTSIPTDTSVTSGTGVGGSTSDPAPTSTGPSGSGVGVTTSDPAPTSTGPSGSGVGITTSDPAPTSTGPSGSGVGTTTSDPAPTSTGPFGSGVGTTTSDPAPTSTGVSRTDVVISPTSGSTGPTSGSATGTGGTQPTTIITPTVSSQSKTGTRGVSPTSEPTPTVSGSSGTIGESGTTPSETAVNPSSAVAPTSSQAPSTTSLVGPTSQQIIPTISEGPILVNSATPTGSVSGTSWLPESLIFASSISLASGATQSAEPSNFPAIIPNPTGVITTIPEGLSLVQIGFKFSLNWQFVASHSVSASQIMDLLPQGLMYGLDLQSSQVEVDSLVPLDTTEQLGFTTTVAHVYLSDNMTDTLRLDLLIPASKLYSNPNANVNQLMSYISVAIPISVDSTFTDTTSSATGNAASPTTNSNSGVFDTQPQDTSSSVTKNAVGVSFAVAGAAAAYGAAMFFIARRYKKRRQNHRRSSSVMSHSEMRQSGSPALVGGANTYMAGGRGSPNDRDSRGSGSTGQSGRTQQISGPMMAENSLGWN